MVLFKRYANTALFLEQSDLANPGYARAGLLLPGTASSVDSFTVDTTTWSSALYVFFEPATRTQSQWQAFATAIQALFEQTTNLQFAFVSEASGSPAVVSSLIVETSGGASTLQDQAQFNALNVTVNIQAPPMTPPAVSWDDANNQFLLSNLSGGTAVVTFAFQGAVSGSVQLSSMSQNLLLPLSGPLAGCINSTYQCELSDLATMEAGLMYFGPPATTGAPLLALNYPLISPASGATQLNFSFWFDVLAPLDVARSFFQATDTQLGSYFASDNGQAFSLTTTGSGDITDWSRFVLAYRPVNPIQGPGDVPQFFYLCAAGTFQVQPPATQSHAALGSSNLLCGITGTEFLEVGNDTGVVDTLTFIPNNPAYASMSPESSTQLEPSYNFTLTSWVEFGTTKGAYVSQPEQSPLFEQGATARVSLDSNGTNSAHLLNFLPLPTWVPKNGSKASTPAVPMVPYAGIPNTLDLSPFRSMETAALNPTRRDQMMSAKHNTTNQILMTQATDAATYAMTPQGLLAGLTADTPPVWTSLWMAQPATDKLQLTAMGPEIQNVLKQNRIFLVDSTLTGPNQQTLFGFAGSDQQVNISDWIFNLSPGGEASPAPDNVPPILIFKFWDGQSISNLIDDVSLWSSADIFNNGQYTATQAQAYLKKVIADAQEAAKTPDSIYANFVAVVTDPGFAGILAINGNLQLNELPSAIQAVMGGMSTTDATGKRVSNLGNFRTHHIGIQISDTEPTSSVPTISQSSFFALVDYEKPVAPKAKNAGNGVSLDSLAFEVEYLRALFTNSELRTFDCQLNLMLNELFDVGVTLQASEAAAADDGNIITIQGSYQNHSSGSAEGEGVYSFVTQGTFDFNFANNAYLQKIELTKLQFSFQQSDDSSSTIPGSTPTLIQSRFSLWGALTFNELDMLDIFSFESLSFADLAITVSFDLTLDPPSTSKPVLIFSPGDLRLDLGQTRPREGDTSLLSLLPFRLKSFLYSENASQSLESLNYFKLSSVPGIGINIADTFNYALLFDLDLGAAGGLVGSLAAFKFGFLIGWLNGGEVAFGVQMPEADGKLEIKIQGVFDLIIETFVLQYVDTTTPPMLVIGMMQTTVEILGKRLPPSGAIDFVLFKPTDGNAQIGWMVAYDNETKSLEAADARQLSNREPARLAATAGDSGDGDGSFNLKYLGLGQRVGPDPTSSPTTFADFLAFMTTDFAKAFADKKYDELYHPDGRWLIVADIELLNILELGFVFYDVTPFYSLSLNVTKLFSFEITYTKVSDTIGLYYAVLTLPNELRTFQAGAASLTLPSLELSIYTNGDWKANLGFPKGSDWSGCFKIEFMLGPIPVTGAGGFYIASMSSATLPVFKGNYPSILAFGLAVRVGVGKDFTAGPLSAGVSITFFGIIEGAAGYLSSGSTSVFSEPNALRLNGQFGLIGQIYGSIDFVIVKASVNVTLSASVGIVLYLEKGYGDGSVLLYVEATVSVSVSVQINLLFFSITISFSFDATFRFQWQLVGSGAPQNAVPMLARSTQRLAAAATPSVLPLCPGFSTTMPLWFLPELTVVFTDSVNPGAPALAFSLAVEFDPAPKKPTYTQFKPFEQLTTQLATWSLMQALGLSAYNSSVTQEQLNEINEHPDDLTGFLTYDLLLQQLAVFTNTTVTVPSASSSNPQSVSAATYPMLPFLNLATQGRLNSNGKAADLQYTFAAQNLVSDQYLQIVDAYLNQLFVNAGESKTQGTLTSDATTTPLSQQIFLEYFKGLIASAVNQLVQTIENQGLSEQALDQLFLAVVAAGGLAAVGGQMSSMFRGGARLPYTTGLTLPDAIPSTTTNPLQSLLWQQFPVGQLSPASKPASGVTNQYSVLLTQPDTSRPWITASVNYTLTNLDVDPYSKIVSTSITAPQQPTLIPYTDSGPQAFSFTNLIPWTQPGVTGSNLCPLPLSMLALVAEQAGTVDVLVQTRTSGKANAGEGTPLPSGSFAWATTIQLIARQIPANAAPNEKTATQTFLPNVYAIGGSSQAEQALLASILQNTGTVASIQVLYQTAAGASGLSSATVNNADIFVLRTNTTTVSAPPVPMLATAMAAPPEPTISVGANAGDVTGFLQILEEVSITNAPGYYLHYADAAGHDLPSDLFNAGPAPITILITYIAAPTQNTAESPSQVSPSYNSVVLNNVDPSLVYYASTVDPKLNLQYASVAAGAVGAELMRSQQSTQLLTGDGKRISKQVFMENLPASVRDHYTLSQALTAAGAVPAQLNALYSLVTYKMEATAGVFIESNLSAPIQPQAPAGADEQAPRSYRAFIPLYALAVSNQNSGDQGMNRYASLNGTYAVDFFLTDTFGNLLPGTQRFTGKNLYFDSIVALDTWQGIVPSFDFTGVGTNQVKVTLTPSQVAFQNLTKDNVQGPIDLYQTISTQIGGPGVTFSIASNLSLQADGTFASVTLNATQTASVTKLVNDLLAYLLQVQQGTAPATWPLQPVELTVTLAATSRALPPAFGLSVQFGIQRDISLIDPSLIGPGGVVILPSAQSVATTIAPDALAQTNVGAFAEEFATAFPSLLLALGLGGAQSLPNTTSSMARLALESNGLAAGPSVSTGSTAAPALWALAKSVVQINIDNPVSHKPFYSSPKPLLNALESGTVPMPKMPAGLTQLGAEQTFVDVDLDAFNTNFFAAVDQILQPASASALFQKNPAAYKSIAFGREQLAVGYSLNEVDWLFPAGTFTASATELSAAQEFMEQQCRASLMSAYSIDTLLQFPVTWNQPLPAGAGGNLSLFGSVQPVAIASAGTGTDSSKTTAFSSDQIELPPSGSTGLLTFAYSSPNVITEDGNPIPLQFTLSHVQVFTAPDTGGDQARPSLWLQLVPPPIGSKSIPSLVMSIGPEGSSTTIPIVLRQYPTPPTLQSQSGTAPEQNGGNGANTTLEQAAAWIYKLRYQSQLTRYDQLISYITWNTTVSPQVELMAAPTPSGYTLFQALCRFTAAYPILKTTLSVPADPNYAAAATSFASLVSDVVGNSDWTDWSNFAFGSTDKVSVTDQYTIDDNAQNDGTRVVQLTWGTQQSSMPGGTVGIVAVAPSGIPYETQIYTQLPNGMKDTYTPQPPVIDNWVCHELSVSGIDVLTAENARAAIQIERNLISIDGQTVQPEFVYMTPFVEAAQPVTPLLDNDDPINVATLPQLAAGTVCPSAIPANLCQRIYNLLMNLLTVSTDTGNSTSTHRLKIGCSFSYPLNSAAGQPPATQPLMPLVPVALARSFDLQDNDLPAQVGAFASQFAITIQSWASDREIQFGQSATPSGGELVFDVTLFAQLSGNSRPLLRLRNLQLALGDIAPPNN